MLYIDGENFKLDTEYRADIINVGATQMTTEVKPNLQLEVAHVLFIDVVGYSKQLIDDQRDLQDQLNRLVRDTQEFRAAEADGKLVRLPTGDGMALVFFTRPEAPIQCALEISRALSSYPRLQLRMGVNTGPVSGTTDVNNRSNIAGAGINTAKRVMDCGDAGHILVSKRSADDLAQYRYWHPYLHDIGECEVKHGETVSVFNLFSDDFGNAALPEKFKQKKRKSAATFFHKPKNIALLICSGFAISALAVFFLTRERAARPVEKSIAVLPFENLSDDKENAYFAGGIQDDVLMNLARIGDLKVISRTSTMQYKGNPRNVREIGRILGVAAVLEGSVRRSGNRVRVNVQLINTSNDAHIWAEDYDRELTDIFAIQSDLALQIASTLQSKLSPIERARLQQRPTESAEAYLIYLEAQDALGRSQSGSDLEKVAQLYERAIQADPSFALAFARLSYVEGTLYQGIADPVALEKARTAANEALRLQPALPEAHLALGYIYYRANGDYERALQELAVAKAGLPNDPDIFLVIGSIERRQGKWSESTADFNKAVSLSPKSSILWTNLAINYQSLRNFPAAASAFDRGAAADPNFFMTRCLRARLDIDWKGDTGPMERLLARLPEASDPDGKVAFARFELALFQRNYNKAIETVNKSGVDSFSGWSAGVPFPKSFLLAESYRLLNDDAQARSYFEDAQRIVETQVRENSVDASRHALLGQIYAGLGRKDDAIREGKRAGELLPESKDALDGPVITLALAKIYARVGDSDSALSLLEHSLSSISGVTVPVLQLDPAWDSLRGDPRFQKMVASLSSAR
jgi:TolB-like protein/class 3 adenylate cyclase/Flp pilus assembly protein TadD